MGFGKKINISLLQTESSYGAIVMLKKQLGLGFGFSSNAIGRSRAPFLV
jgi:hypothetical protein